MNKLTLLVIGFLLVTSLAFGGQKTLNFAWQQDLPTPVNDLAGWGLYQSATPGGPYSKFLDIPYVSPQTEYTAGTPITVPDGQVNTLYFVIDAVDTSGNRSGGSNEVVATIDFKPPEDPIYLKLTIVVTTTP